MLEDYHLMVSFLMKHHRPTAATATVAVHASFSDFWSPLNVKVDNACICVQAAPYNKRQPGYSISFAWAGGFFTVNGSWVQRLVINESLGLPLMASGSLSWHLMHYTKRSLVQILLCFGQIFYKHVPRALDNTPISTSVYFLLWMGKRKSVLCI